MISISDIQKNLRGTIAVDEPMAKYTWMKVGGPADFYIEPADKDDLLAIIRYFRQQHFPWMMIGRGSNVLVSDEGIRGAVPMSNPPSRLSFRPATASLQNRAFG